MLFLFDRAISAEGSSFVSTLPDGFKWLRLRSCVCILHCTDRLCVESCGDEFIRLCFPCLPLSPWGWLSIAVFTHAREPWAFLGISWQSCVCRWISLSSLCSTCSPEQSLFNVWLSQYGRIADNIFRKFKASGCDVLPPAYPGVTPWLNQTEDFKWWERALCQSTPVCDKY